MRNLAVYPITTEDVVQALDDSYLYQVGKGYIGDTACLSLNLLKEFIRDSEEFKEFLKTKEPKNTYE